MTDQQGFLNRWSRLKQQEQTELKVIEEQLPGVDDVAEDETALSLHQLTDEDMPALDQLDQDSDYSGFLSEKVSEALRRKALRKLFHLPEFNIRDGLNEYDEDYSQLVPLGDTVTYQMKQWAERQKEAFKEALEDDDQPAITAPEDASSVSSAAEKSLRHEGEEQDSDDDELGCCD